MEMKKQYMLLVEATNYTSFKHNTIEEAIKEAKRLHLKLNKVVIILEIIGQVTQKEVPVVRKEMVVELQSRIDFTVDKYDIPF